MNENDKKEILKAYKEYLIVAVKKDIFKEIAEDMRKPKVIFQVFWPLIVIIIAWIVISILLFVV